jgi:phosphatidylethanolamine-binding protein (PEBP) family uncharacterized protein
VEIGNRNVQQFFKLYALDTTLELDQRADKKELVNAMEGHILAESRLMGTSAAD